MISKNAPRLRFKGFGDEWQESALSNIAERITRKNSKLESELPLTISAQYGLVDQETFFNKKVASRDLSKYLLIKKGEFAYNKSYSDGYPYGAIKSLIYYDKGVLSSIYIVFALKENIDYKFMNSYFDSSYWYREIATKSTEGVRNHGLLNVAPKDFMSMLMRLPSDKLEQQHIGNFFSKLDHLIDLHSQKLEQLKKLKRGYLQKMFPQKGEMVPRLRFSGFSGDWKEIKLNTLLKVGKSGGTPSTKNKKYYKGDIPFLSIKDVTGSNGIVTSTEKHITEEGLNDSSSWIVPSGALTLSMYASVGEVARFGMDISTSQAFFNMIFNEKTSSDFMYYYLKEFNLSGSWNRLIATGTQSNLNAKSIKNAVLKIPGVDEQEKIYIFLNHLDDVINENSDKIEELNRQKKAYLQKMFI